MPRANIALIRVPIRLGPYWTSGTGARQLEVAARAKGAPSEAETSHCASDIRQQLAATNTGRRAPAARRAASAPQRNKKTMAEPVPAPDVGDLPDLPDAPGVLGPPVVDVPGSAVQIAVQTPAPAQPEAPHPGDVPQFPPGFPMMMPPTADGQGYPPVMVMPPYGYYYMPQLAPQQPGQVQPQFVPPAAGAAAPPGLPQPRVPPHAFFGYMPAAEPVAPPPAPPKKKAAPRKRQKTSRINRSLIGFEHDPRDVAFESLRFSDSLRSQYNNALRHFVGYVKERKMDPAEAVVFVSPDGVAKDDMLRDFARYLHDSDGVTDSVFRNCLKWMQKNLEAQMTALDLPPPKAYVSRLPGMRELNHLQRPKQMAQRAIADAKDAELIRKLNAKGRGVAPGP